MIIYNRPAVISQGFVCYPTPARYPVYQSVATAQPIKAVVTPRDRAAIVIQRFVRKMFLSRMSLYRSLCLKAESMNRAPAGHTPVYLPAEANVVLKYERLGAANRHSLSNRVRKVAKELNCKHLVVPKEYLVSKNFVVAHRLPIDTDDTRNLQRYLKEPRLFDKAVREMTRLFSKMHFVAMTRFETHYISSWNIRTTYLRYDNFPLYIEEMYGKRVGKIGLIDVEGARFETEPRLEDLAKAFPLHQEIIKAEANRLGMNVDCLGSKNTFFCSVRSPSQYNLPSGEFVKEHKLWLERSGAPQANTMKEIPSAVQQGTIEWIEKQLTNERCAGDLAKKLAPLLYSTVVDKLKLLISANQWEEEDFEPIKAQYLEIQQKRGIPQTFLNPEPVETPKRILRVDRAHLSLEIAKILAEMSSPQLPARIAEGVLFDLREKVICNYHWDIVAFSQPVYFYIAY